MALQSSTLGPPIFAIGAKPSSPLHCCRFKAVSMRILRTNNRYSSFCFSNCVQFRSYGSILCTIYEETDGFEHGARLGCGVRASSNGSSVPEPNCDFVREVAKCGIVFTAIVYGVFVVGCKNVLATEGVVSFGRDFVGQGMLTFRNAWPKALLVLKIFKEQGFVLALLLGLSAFFSMAETSITTLWPWKVRELAEKEPEDGVFKMLRTDVTRFLTTILIGTTVVNIGATALVTDAATAAFGEAGVSAATGVMTVAILLLTELTPKSIAVHNATEVARVVVRPVAWLSVILYPVGRIVTYVSMGMLKILGMKGRSEPFVTEEELKLMLRGAELSGAIEEEEQVMDSMCDCVGLESFVYVRIPQLSHIEKVENPTSIYKRYGLLPSLPIDFEDMIENVLEIKDTHVREVMTPLIDVVAIDGNATLVDFHNLWLTHQYSRVPVFEQRIDNIVGIAYAMDLLDFVQKGEVLESTTAGEMAHKPAYFVPDSMLVWNLLREFRIRKVHMAVVLNEYGGTVGIVTLEDVVEEIVGEIFDENDSKEEIQKKTGYIVMTADGIYDVDANTAIDHLSEDLNIKMPEGHQYETVSGFVCEAFGYIPRTGESVKVVLEKEDEEEEESNSENKNQKERRLIFNIEILAGNARKVSAVRFERVDDGNTEVARLVPKVMKKKWSSNGESGNVENGHLLLSERLDDSLSREHQNNDNSSDRN